MSREIIDLEQFQALSADRQQVMSRVKTQVMSSNFLITYINVNDGEVRSLPDDHVYSLSKI